MRAMRLLLSKNTNQANNILNIVKFATICKYAATENYFLLQVLIQNDFAVLEPLSTKVVLHRNHY